MLHGDIPLSDQYEVQKQARMQHLSSAQNGGKYIPLSYNPADAVQCDGKTPECSQCAFSRRKCPGYTTEWTFITEKPRSSIDCGLTHQTNALIRARAKTPAPSCVQELEMMDFGHIQEYNSSFFLLCCDHRDALGSEVYKLTAVFMV